MSSAILDTTFERVDEFDTGESTDWIAGVTEEEIEAEESISGNEEM